MPSSYIKHRPKNFVTRSGRVMSPSRRRRVLRDAVAYPVICLIISANIAALLVEVPRRASTHPAPPSSPTFVRQPPGAGA